MQRLTFDPSTDVVPSWSRDGRWIYFTSRRTGRAEVWKIAPGGGAEQQVTRNGGFHAQEAADGRTLYYTKQRVVSELFAMPVEAGPERRAMLRVSGERPESLPVFVLAARRTRDLLYGRDTRGEPKRASQRYRICYFDFPSRAITTLLDLPRRPTPKVGSGIRRYHACGKIPVRWLSKMRVAAERVTETSTSYS
ncbi:MAG: TolB family protein [Bryobacteraceae bacterium]